MLSKRDVSALSEISQDAEAQATVLSTEAIKAAIANISAELREFGIPASERLALHAERKGLRAELEKREAEHA